MNGKPETHSETQVNKLKGAIENFMLINNVQQIFENQKDKNKNEANAANQNKNTMIYTYLKKGLTLKFQDIERFKL